MTDSSYLTSHDGLTLPAVGFGTYQLKGEAGVGSILDAIDVGYRLLDSAFNYENEGTVGEAVRRTGVPREELIVTSKLPGRHHAYELAAQSIAESVFRTGLGYLDLHLIHWPNPKVGKYVEAWRAMIDAREAGLVRHIGVCNFEPEHLETLLAETGELPSVNQIEVHPYFPNLEVIAWNRDHGIITEGWSPLGRGTQLLQEPVIVEMAGRLGSDPAAIVLAWHRALGVLPLPKSGNRERQLANLATSLVLSGDEVAQISALARPDGRTAGQDPRNWEEF